MEWRIPDMETSRIVHNQDQITTSWYVNLTIFICFPLTSHFCQWSTVNPPNSGMLYESLTHFLLLCMTSTGVQPSLLTLRPNSAHNGTSNRSSGSSQKSGISSSSPPSDKRHSSPDTDDENRVIFKVCFKFWFCISHLTAFYSQSLHSYSPSLPPDLLVWNTSCFKSS